MRQKRQNTKACRYCKKRFKPTGKGSGGKPRVTCGKPACMKLRRAELHAAYMRLPRVKKKQAAYLKEYRTRPEVLRHRKLYDKERAALKKKDAGIRTPNTRLCSFCFKKYKPTSKWAAVHCGKALCKKKWRHLYARLYMDGRVILFLESGLIRGLNKKA